jgi:transposase InsO family protein
VPEKPVRRRFDAEYKARILREADQLTEPGQVGALLRREGLYSSHLSVWRKQRDEAALAGLVPKRRGRKPDPNAELVAENQRLVRENAKLMRKLRRTEAILDVQKKLSEILGIELAPNQVWTWDITKLLGPAKWTSNYLYVILDIYSRYVVGWMLASRESRHLAERLIRETLVKEGIGRDQLTIHSDRGAAMRSQAVAQLLATFGVTKSHSRPHVSDDNPFSESQFETLKYRPDFPDRFASHDHGLDFCRGFFHWHNEEHRHWGIGLLTPAVVHTGHAEAAVESRASVLAAAHARHPERFVRGLPRPLKPAAEVWINPPENRPQVRTLELPRDSKFVSQVSQSH